MAELARGPIGFRLAHELEGLLQGIRADGTIDALERERLWRWLEANRPFADIRPFSELSHYVERALEDGEVTIDECDDLLFVVRKLTTVNPYFDSFRAGLQVLTGMLAGITADRAFNEPELRALSNWAEEWAHLAGLWPFDECRSVVTAMLARKRVVEEVGTLKAFAAQFPVAGHDQWDATVPPLIGGICSVDPEFVFRDKSFVFTGESAHCTREEMREYIGRLGGTATKSVTKNTDYLVVCDEGCPHWAFACYGRKVEKAYSMRRLGHRITIAHEADFWDALTGEGVSA